MTIMNIPYNPQTDPKAMFAQGFSNMLGGAQQGLDRRRIAKFAETLGADDTAIQILSKGLKSGIDPQTAMAIGALKQKSLMSIPQLRAQEATRMGARPGTREFENIAEGPEKEERIIYKDAQDKTRMIRAAGSDLPAIVDQIIEQGGTIDTTKSTLLGERLEIYREAKEKGDKEGAELALYGKPMVEISLGKPASSAERTAIAETRASIDALDNLKSLFDSTKTRTGPIVGRVDPLKGLVGLTTDEQEGFMAATSAFKNAIIKEITGAQMSQEEAERIMKQVPDITDPSTRWEAKWEQSKKNLEFLQKRRAEILEQSGLRVPTGADVKSQTKKQVESKIDKTDVYKNAISEAKNQLGDNATNEEILDLAEEIILGARK